MKRTWTALMSAGVLALAAGYAVLAAPVPLERASITDLQQAMTTGRLSAEQLTRFYLDRIARMDQAGPSLHAIIALNPSAVADARALDAERKQKGPRGPLHGVPILIKDNIETADPMATTAGSLALAANRTGRDSPLVARLRAAGAIILGKANLSEWANIRSTHSISGWSAMGGLVKNPYALDRTACGSSSGSAAAVAAGFAAAAVGSETDGSVVCPSSANGVVGLKPTLGLIPRTHIVPISHSQDTAGPITRTVADAALLASIMAGSDGGDPASAEADAHRSYANPGALSLKGKRFGVLRQPADQHQELTSVYNAELDRLKAAGAVLVEVKTPGLSKIGPDEQLVLYTDLKADLNAYLATAAPGVAIRSLADAIAFNASNPAETPLFGQEIFIAAEATKGQQDPAYIAARAESYRLAGPDGIDRLLAADHLDALIAPTQAPAWRVDLVYGDNDPGGFSTLPAVSGYPHLTLPMGTVRGLPVGISVIGTKWADWEVLVLGAAIEAVTPPIPPPAFPATVDIP